jgi:hypothetical protein
MGGRQPRLRSGPIRGFFHEPFSLVPGCADDHESKSILRARVWELRRVTRPYVLWLVNDELRKLAACTWVQKPPRQTLQPIVVVRDMI